MGVSDEAELPSGGAWRWDFSTNSKSRYFYFPILPMATITLKAHRIIHQSSITYLIQIL